MPRYYDDHSSEFKKAAADEFRNGTVVAAYSVMEDGRTDNVRIVEADPSELPDFADRVRMQLTRMVHRPRVSDGAIVAAHDVTYRHEFLYRDADIETARQRELAASEDR